MARILAGLALGAAALATALLVNTLRFVSRQVQIEPAASVHVDTAAAARRLSEALRFRTVSRQDPAPARSAEFEAFHEYLEGTFPKVHSSGPSCWPSATTRRWEATRARRGSRSCCADGGRGSTTSSTRG